MYKYCLEIILDARTQRSLPSGPNAPARSTNKTSGWDINIERKEKSDPSNKYACV
jgi:hypothetical protein